MGFRCFSGGIACWKTAPLPAGALPGIAAHGLQNRKHPPLHRLHGYRIEGSSRPQLHALARDRTKLWPNFYVGTSYEDEVGYLKTWIKQRLDWMDQELMAFGADVTATEPAVLPFEFRVFPNPTPSEVQVSFRLERASTVKGQVYDLWGRIVQESTPGYLTPGDHIVPLRLTAPASSMQFLGLEVDGKRVVVRKVLRE